MRITHRLLRNAAISTLALMTSVALMAPDRAQAQVKVGIIAPFSGPFAHYGALFKAGAEAYLASQGENSRDRVSK